MRVNCNYKDDFGRYEILAEVSSTGRVSVIEIRDEYDNEIDIDDFSQDEVHQIGFLAKRAADDLNNMPDEDDDDDQDNEA